MASLRCEQCTHDRRYHHHGVCTVCVRWQQRYPTFNFAPGHRFTTDAEEVFERTREAIKVLGQGSPTDLSDDEIQRLLDY